jgi:hypothetical protein
VRTRNQAALEALQALPDSQYRQALVNLTQWLYIEFNNDAFAYAYKFI